MQLEELMAKVSRLPAFRQQEVLDFVTFLEQQHGRAATLKDDNGEWSEQQFQIMSVDQAMRGISDESDLYSEDDLKERWS